MYMSVMWNNKELIALHLAYPRSDGSSTHLPGRLVGIILRSHRRSPGSQTPQYVRFFQNYLNVFSFKLNENLVL